MRIYMYIFIYLFMLFYLFIYSFIYLLVNSCNILVDYWKLMELPSDDQS